jgi:uncharacterized protein (TIGR03066 family)
MSAVRLLLAGLVLAVAGSNANAQEKTDWAKMIVGKWEVTKGDMSTVQEGSIFTFDAAGNLTLNLVFGKQKTTFQATWKIEGDTLTTQVKGSPPPGRKQTLKKISDKELVWEETNKKVTELKKK